MPNSTQQETTKRIVISKSAKRKMNGQKHEGDNRPKKAGAFTQMVVYHVTMPTGERVSITEHERVN